MPLHVPLRRNSHPSSGARSTLKHSLAFQPQESFRRRQEADAQFGCNFTSGNDLAGGKLSAEYALVNKYVGSAGQTPILRQ